MTAAKKTSESRAESFPSPRSFDLIGPPSPDQMEETLPPGLSEGGRGVAQPLERPGAVILLARRLVRPVDQEGPSLHLVTRQHPPEPAVAAVVAVVAQHEQVPGSDGLRSPVVARIATLAVLRVPGMERGLQEMHVGLLQGLAVDVDRLLADLHRLAGQ